MTVTVLHNQSLLDISICLFGSASSALKFAIENDISITDDLEVGKVLKVPKSVESELKLVAEYFQMKKINPATAITSEYLNEINYPEGIEYWGVGIDFEIQ